MANGSRKPRSHKLWLDSAIEREIVALQKQTRYGRKRLLIHLKRKFQGNDNSIIQPDMLTFGLIKGIFKRYKLKIKRVRTANGTQRQQLYAYDKLALKSGTMM